MSRFTRFPRSTAAADLIAVLVIAIEAVRNGVRWVSAAAAEQSGETPTGRVLAARAETRRPTPEEREEAIALARRAEAALRTSPRSFDQSLHAVAATIVNGSAVALPGALSVAAYLAFWAARLDEREANRPAAEGGFAAILSLFANAAGRLKYPRITFSGLPGIGNLKIQRAASGRNAGGLNLTDGLPFGQNRFFGAITPDGDFRPGRDVPPALREFLSRLAADPATVAGEYGKGSGSCCFCSKELTDDRSVVVGYGPVCAGHYGLPWGEAR